MVGVPLWLLPASVRVQKSSRLVARFDSHIAAIFAPDHDEDDDDDGNDDVDDDDDFDGDDDNDEGEISGGGG